MVIEYIRYEVPENRRAGFERAYGEASKVLDASGHCLGYEVSRGLEEPGRFVVRIEWDSVEGHERGFRESPEFGTFLRQVRPFLGDIREMSHYEATATRGGKDRAENG